MHFLASLRIVNVNMKPTTGCRALDGLFLTLSPNRAIWFPIP